jgi:hypothetical protein
MASFYKLPLERFAHRENQDGAANSICLACFATVTCAPLPATLGMAETAHDCWQSHETVLSLISRRGAQA